MGLAAVVVSLRLLLLGRRRLAFVSVVRPRSCSGTARTHSFRARSNQFIRGELPVAIFVQALECYRGVCNLGCIHHAIVIGVQRPDYCDWRRAVAVTRTGRTLTRRWTLRPAIRRRCIMIGYGSIRAGGGRGRAPPFVPRGGGGAGLIHCFHGF